jgi:hypothetical protein
LNFIVSRVTQQTSMRDENSLQNNLLAFMLC